MRIDTQHLTLTGPGWHQDNFDSSPSPSSFQLVPDPGGRVQGEDGRPEARLMELTSRQDQVTQEHVGGLGLEGGQQVGVPVSTL